MKKLKVIAAEILACSMACLLTLTGCGASQSGLANSNSGQENSQAAETSGVSTDASDSNQSGSGNPASLSELTAFDESGTIEETVLYDSDNIVITATELTYNSYKAELGLKIENGSDKNLSFVSGSLGYSMNAVNHVMISDGYMNSDVMAGKNASETISFSYDDLEIFGINSIASIEIAIQIEDEDYKSEYTGPLEVKTSLYDGYDFSANKYAEAVQSGLLDALSGSNVSVSYRENTAFDDSGIKMLSEAYAKTEDGSGTLILELVNEADETLYASASDISACGLQVSSGRWTSLGLLPGHRGYMTIDFSNLLDVNMMTALGMNQISQASVNLSVLDSEGKEVSEGKTVSCISDDGNQQYVYNGTELFNDNGIKISSVGFAKDGLSYSDDINILLLAENTSDEELYIDSEYGTFSINDQMSDAIMYSEYAEPGKTTLLTIQISSYDLEDAGITDISEIEQAEITLSVRDSHYDEVAKPVITIVNE